MRAIFAFILAAHALVHLMGFSKAFGLAEIAALHQAISRPAGALWLLAALLFLATAILVFAASDWWWLPAAPALVISQALIVSSWGDAKFGTIANAIILIPLVLSLIDFSPWSYRSSYRREVAAGLQRQATSTTVVTEVDLARLPGRDFRARFRGTFRRGADAAAKVVSILQVVDAKGPEMNEGETVTLFNDMCLLAPATLVDADVVWEGLDARSVKATFSNAGQTISAVLSFDEAGALTNFVSDDRGQSADGKTYRNLRWSTPVQGYRDFDGRKVVAVAEARWTEPAGEYAYARFELTDIEYNLRP